MKEERIKDWSLIGLLARGRWERGVGGLGNRGPLPRRIKWGGGGEGGSWRKGQAWIRNSKLQAPLAGLFLLRKDCGNRGLQFARNVAHNKPPLVQTSNACEIVVIYLDFSSSSYSSVEVQYGLRMFFFFFFWRLKTLKNKYIFFKDKRSWYERTILLTCHTYQLSCYF